VPRRASPRSLPRRFCLLLPHSLPRRFPSTVGLHYQDDFLPRSAFPHSCQEDFLPRSALSACIARTVASPRSSLRRLPPRVIAATAASPRLSLRRQPPRVCRRDGCLPACIVRTASPHSSLGQLAFPVRPKLCHYLKGTVYASERCL